MNIPDNSARKEYIARINRVINHINNNLNSKLNLEELAVIACFSKYHFHRIFKALTGESLYGFVRRLRLEKAANKLKQSIDIPITDIAFDCGFSSSSNFAVAFKDHFGVSASAYRKNPNSANSKISKADSKITEDSAGGFLYNVDQKVGTHNHEIRREDLMERVVVKDLPAYHVAYVRHIGSYFECGAAWGKICSWAGPRRLFGPQTTMLGVSYDDPDVTPVDKCRYDACLTVPADTKVDGEVGLMDIPAGTYGVFHMEDTADKIKSGYGFIFGEWLPDSGYQADDRQCLEIYYNDAEKHPEKKFIMDICVPVKPL